MDLLKVIEKYQDRLCSKLCRTKLKRARVLCGLVSSGQTITEGAVISLNRAHCQSIVNKFYN